MFSENPFQYLFETFGKRPEAHAESVNRTARENLLEALDKGRSDAGQFILLKAPRAGHGKTHLLNCVLQELGGTHEFIPLHAAGGSRMDAASVLDDTVRRLTRGLPAAGGLVVLDLVARRLFAASLLPLVESGEIPCRDREGAVKALEERPIETFDFQHPLTVTAQWAKENFSLLRPRLAQELSQRHSLSQREVSFWLDAMFRFASAPISDPDRVAVLETSMKEGSGGDTLLHDRLSALLGLLASLLRVVLVADEVEGFTLDEPAALRFATFVCALRQTAPQVDVLLSVNEDVWQNAFVPRLSGGLEDRLTEVVVELMPLDREGMVAVLESRAPGRGESILSGMGTRPPATHARAILREAAKASRGKPTAKAESGAIPPVPVLFPVSEAPVSTAKPPSEPDAKTLVMPSEFPQKPETALKPAPVPAVVPAAPPASPAQADSVPETLTPEINPSAEFRKEEEAVVAEKSPFEIAPPLATAPIAPKSAPPDTADRVEELLRQFRERYGKS